MGKSKTKRAGQGIADDELGGAKMSKAKLKCDAATKEITPERAFKAMY